MEHKDLQVPAAAPPTRGDPAAAEPAAAKPAGGGGGGGVTTDGLVTFNGAVVDVRSLQAQLVSPRSSATRSAQRCTCSGALVQLSSIATLSLRARESTCVVCACRLLP